MKSLFDDKVRQAICNRIQKLTLESQRQWGSMSPQRLLIHLVTGLEVCFGDKEVEVRKGFPNNAFGRWMVTTAPMPVPKNMKSSMAATTDSMDFTGDKQRILDYVDRFGKGREQKWGMHPAFGKLSPEQWARLQYKHLNHHLTQFGC